MTTNLEIDETLVEEARKLGKYRNKKQAVVAALTEFVRHRKQLAILDLAGKIDFDPTYDHKTARKKR